MIMDDRIRIVDGLRELAMRQAADSELLAADATGNLADELATELQPANLPEAMNAFVESAFYLDHIWRQLPATADVLGGTYGLPLSFDELATTLLEWEIPGGQHERTHVPLPVGLIQRLATFIEQVSSIYDGRQHSPDSVDIILDALAQLAVSQNHTVVVVAQDEQPPVRYFAPLVAAMRNAAEGQRPTRWPMTPDAR